jgi:hypothetical protein
MTWRTPPSLKWLIKNRSRLSGRIEQLQSTQALLKEQVGLIEVRINKFKQQLSALDQTFQLHEIQVDPTGLRSIVPWRNKRLVPHGEMTRQILRMLRHHEGWASTSQIASKIAERVSTSLDKETSNYIHIVVRRRLRRMASNGQLQRIVGAQKGRCYDGSNQSLWRLSSVNESSGDVGSS